MEGNLGLIATGKAINGTAHMELWRKNDYTYEIEVRGSISDQYKEVFNETPFKVALKKFEKKVGEVKLW